jgi:oxygen-independent coproporphyrinogen-3 oxidase
MEKGIALYIHIPFCRQKCLYCDFPSFAKKENLMPEYVAALCKELETKADKKIKTIFIGGGTPTYLSLECFDLLKKSLSKLDKDSELEFTVEGNPDSFSREKLEFLKTMGVNRLSIGLQAWQEELLRKLGRVHNLEQFKKAFEYVSNQLEGKDKTLFRYNRTGELYFSFRAASQAYGLESYWNLPQKIYNDPLSNEVTEKLFH